MKTKLVIVCFLITLPILSRAQNGNERKLRRLAIDRDQGATTPRIQLSISQTKFQKAALVNYVVVDSMYNISGMSSSELNPLAYDPDLNLLTFTHRGDRTSYAPTSGAIYYNYSADGGLTWPRIPTPFNYADTLGIRGSYPSGAIFNPTNNLSDSYQFAAWPNISSGFGQSWDLGYGYDHPIGQGSVAGDRKSVV